MTVRGTAPSVGPENPLVLGGGGEEKARPDIPIQIPNQEQMAAATSERKNTTFITGQPLILWGEPTPPLLSSILLLYITALVHRQQFLFRRLLPFFNALPFFLDHSSIISEFAFFPLKSCMQKYNLMAMFQSLLRFPYKGWNFPNLSYLNNLEFSTFSFQQEHVFGSNAVLRVFFILLWRDQVFVFLAPFSKAICDSCNHYLTSDTKGQYRKFYTNTF